MELPLSRDDGTKDIEKFCSKCKTLVSIEYFHKQPNTHDGLSYKCKDCAKTYAKKRYKIYTAESKKTGRCNAYGCQKKAAVGGRLCENHFFKNASLNRLGCYKYAKTLQALAERQNYTCPLTGDKLVPTVNMSLDHIKPCSKFPELSKDINNVQWVTKWANAAKWDLTTEEFIAQCKQVYENNKHKNPQGSAP